MDVWARSRLSLLANRDGLSTHRYSSPDLRSPAVAGDRCGQHLVLVVLATRSHRRRGRQILGNVSGNCDRSCRPRESRLRCSRRCAHAPARRHRDLESRPRLQEVRGDTRPRPLRILARLGFGLRDKLARSLFVRAADEQARAVSEVHLRVPAVEVVARAKTIDPVRSQVAGDDVG